MSEFPRPLNPLPPALPPSTCPGSLRVGCLPAETGFSFAPAPLAELRGAHTSLLLSLFHKSDSSLCQEAMYCHGDLLSWELGTQHIHRRDKGGATASARNGPAQRPVDAGTCGCQPTQGCVGVAVPPELAEGPACQAQASRRWQCVRRGWQRLRFGSWL